MRQARLTKYYHTCMIWSSRRRVGEFEMDVKEARQIADIDSTVVSINFESDAKEDGTGCNVSPHPHNCCLMLGQTTYGPLAVSA